jgi:hypothetical protein
MIVVRPYISEIDQRVETVALLALGGVAHIASLFTLGGMLDPEYLVLIISLALVPLVTLIGLKTIQSRRIKAAHRASRAARGRQAVGAVRAVKTAVRQLPQPPVSTMGDSESEEETTSHQTDAATWRATIGTRDPLTSQPSPQQSDSPDTILLF